MTTEIHNVRHLRLRATNGWGGDELAVSTARAVVGLNPKVERSLDAANVLVLPWDMPFRFHDRLVESKVTFSRYSSGFWSIERPEQEGSQGSASDVSSGLGGLSDVIRLASDVIAGLLPCSSVDLDVVCDPEDPAPQGKYVLWVRTSAPLLDVASAFDEFDEKFWLDQAPEVKARLVVCPSML